MNNQQLCIGRMQGGLITNLIVFKDQMSEAASVAAKCPTCGHVAETEVIGKMSVPNPLSQETVRLHADCDLKALYDELSTAVRNLSEYFDWR